jgi:hypothetical protein
VKIAVCESGEPAIIGDFSGYASRPLHSFMHESNRGGHLYLAKDEGKALGMLGASWHAFFLYIADFRAKQKPSADKII